MIPFKLADQTYIKTVHRFLNLTSKTYPYGYEESFVKEMQKSNILPKNLSIDKNGNYFIKIGNSRTIFTSHFDTACKDQTPVNHVIEGDIIKTDGKSILGADDKAGVTIMLHMIENKIPGLYYFFIGEEVGCIGSGLASKNVSEFKGVYDRIISFDRKGTSSVITHQSYLRSCSDEFADALSKELSKNGLKYEKDDTGVYTDSAEFTDIISECTNISVGYYSEHTTSERQDIKHLAKLADVCLLVNWENLPTKRDCTKVETGFSRYGEYGYSGSSGYNKYGNSTKKTWNSKGYSRSDYDYGQCGFYSSSNKTKTRRSKKKSNTTSIGRVFIEDGQELELLNKPISDKYFTKYEPFKEKLMNTSLSKYEIDMVREQYLDMDNDEDRKYYQLLVDTYL